MEKTHDKHRPLKIAGLFIVAGLVAFAVLSGTLAKYVTTIDNEATARVAVFDVSAGDGSGSFGLFDTILDSDMKSTEDDVETGISTPIIAPGTSGYADITLANDSEVTVEYELLLAVDATVIPLEFSVDGTNWESDLSLISSTGTLAIGAAATDVTVYWRWPFEDPSDPEARDEADTDLGTAAQLAEALVTASVTFTQVD